MLALDARKSIQGTLGVNQDGNFGPTSLAALHLLINTPDDVAWPLSPAVDPLKARWPFAVTIDGEDLVCEDIVITCFGGADDPQDDGQTASGLNTKKQPSLQGVSVAMEGRGFAGLSKAEHAALDGAPIPRIPWGTNIQVTIDGETYVPFDGVIDLGPGIQASKPGQPHALDLTPAAAAFFEPTKSRAELARNFEKRGSFRILGGARYLHPAAAVK